MSWFDIKTMVRRKIGFTQAKVWQDYQTYALILSAAFGGGKKKQEPTPDQLAENMSAEQIIARFKSVVG